MQINLIFIISQSKHVQRIKFPFFLQQISHLFRNINAAISKKDYNGTRTTNNELFTNFSIYLLKETVARYGDIFNKKINKTAYKMNASGSAKKRIKARIYRESVNITFTDEKKWEHCDDCINDEITGAHLNELPVILKYLWEKVSSDIEKEVKNAHILNAAKAILDAILRQKTYIASNCTLSSVKSDSKQNDTFTAFPDILMSLNDKTCRKAELKTPFVAVDYKITGKLLILK
ncbi:hypothetical protein RFI_25858 [Reticulomyxa filosa]|uniref:Uncharacterized protein n=1 Tax=Reticulomyxa filosa TaxID=46433 RepID=X6MCD0_RETFI|nr:hypothetical protein RFI_25858 [Reticulomyxa filosa]|eukprot:ETO11519.1 hypothetical protein RFI_25858 [Reticulomyxa filosa]